MTPMQILKGIGDHMRAQELWWQEEVPRAPVPLHLYLFVPTKVRSVSLLWGMLASLAISEREGGSVRLYSLSYECQT